MSPIDFTKIADCELFVVFNTDNLIQFYYEDNTKSKIIPVLNPEDPYSISLYAAKSDSVENKAESVDGAKPKDCASYLRPNGFALSFSYPDSNDVDHFEIYKSTSSDPETAELLYSGLNTYYLDALNTSRAVNYWVCFVDSNNNKSDFVKFEYHDWSAN